MPTLSCFPLHYLIGAENMHPVPDLAYPGSSTGSTNPISQALPKSPSRSDPNLVKPSCLLLLFLLSVLGSDPWMTGLSVSTLSSSAPLPHSEELELFPQKGPWRIGSVSPCMTPAPGRTQTFPKNAARTMELHTPLGMYKAQALPPGNRGGLWRYSWVKSKNQTWALL